MVDELQHFEFIQAFPVSSSDLLGGMSSEGKSSQRFLLPLFIQNKFSEDDATTKLDIETVTYNNCKKF